LVLVELYPVQDLPGGGSPFSRLIDFLQTASFGAAGVDAPFSVPRQFVLPLGSHEELWRLVSELNAHGRPFATGRQMLELLAPELLPRGRKLYRRTETFWKDKGLNVFSTMWDGPRKGTAFTVACLTVLRRVSLPVWPWERAVGRLMVEAFPAAQLHAWLLPCSEYKGDGMEAVAVRRRVIESLKETVGVSVSAGVERQLVESADALDAFLCAFAAKAVVDAQLVTEPESDAWSEGWIAVHR
jgi:hypothetical protein